jgi:hypothetical protein
MPRKSAGRGHSAASSHHAAVLWKSSAPGGGVQIPGSKMGTGPVGPDLTGVLHRCPETYDLVVRKRDELAQVLPSRQFADWPELRFDPLTSPVVRRSVTRLANP